MAQIRWVLFDAVGTLIFSQPSVEETYRAAALRHGLQLPQEPLAKVLRRHWQASAPSPGQSIDEASEHRRWRSIVGAVFEEQAGVEQLFQELWERFGEPDQWRVYDDVAPAWSALRDRGLHVAIASNFDQRLIRVCRGLPPLDQAEAVFHSAGLGAAKPQSQFFRAVVEQLAAPANPPVVAEECLMVGDSWKHDVEGAWNSGWRAVQIDRLGEDEIPASNIDHSPRPASKAECKSVIQSLRQLAQWIEQAE